MQTHFKKFTRGFTLIELLVVISIIGMLSSVIMVALQGARDKGVVGAGIKFATYNYRYLGANAALIYLFNEQSGTINDTSGNGYNGSELGTITRNAPSFQGGNAFSFDETTPGQVNTSSTFKFNTSKGITLSAWIKTTDANGSIIKRQDTWFDLHIVSGKIAFYDDVDAADYVLSNRIINDGKWHNVTITIASPLGSNIARVYIDGKFDNSRSGGTAFDFPEYNNASVANVGLSLTATLDDIMAFNEPLSLSQIQGIYLAGLPTHSVASK